jgi:hypothetical protein
MRSIKLVIAALAAGTLAAGCGAGGSSPGTTTTTAASTTSAVVYGDAFQLAGAIHGLCTATNNQSARTGTVVCGDDISNHVDLVVKLPPGTWSTYSLTYSGTTIRPVQKMISNGYLYLAFVGAVNDTIKRVTFNS